MQNRHVEFLRRLGIFAVVAAAAYVFTLQFVYPRFFAPFVPFHSDEYQGVGFVALGYHGATFLTWPRPVAFWALFMAGHLGVAGSIVAYACVTLTDLTLAMAIFERYFLRATIPWWVAFAALVFAISGPGFYFSVGYDFEFSLAAFFGLLGIYAWESRIKGKSEAALALCALCFVLCALSKESFLPALVVYCVAAAIFRGPLPLATKATLLVLPFAAAAIALADDRLVASPFVNLNSAQNGEYHVNLAPASLWASLKFYLRPLFNPAFAAFSAACAIGVWIHRRLRLGIGVAIAAFSLYAPYAALPNHLDACYLWAPFPLLALILPSAWISSGSAGLPVLLSRVAIALTLAGTIVFFGVWSAKDDEEAYYLSQQPINSNMLSALAFVKPALHSSKRVLVTGLSFPFHPLVWAAFLTPDLAPGGTWTVASDPDVPPIPLQPTARPIAYRAIRWKDYDLILIFNSSGELAGVYRPQEFANAVARRALTGRSNAAVVSALRGDDLQTPSPAANSHLVYPKGIVPFANEASAQLHGLYPAQTARQCCFLAGHARLRLAKPIGARTAVFWFYVPKLAPFKGRRERVTVAFEGTASGTADLAAGYRNARFSLPTPLAHQATVEASVTMSILFVPRQIRLNNDTRPLSIVLTQVSYE